MKTAIFCICGSNNWETVVETGKLRWATYRFDPYDRHNLFSVLRWPVCGSDGKSYGNACQMKEEACRNQVILEQRPMDYCEGLSSVVVTYKVSFWFDLEVFYFSIVVWFYLAFMLKYLLKTHVCIRLIGPTYVVVLSIWLFAVYAVRLIITFVDVNKTYLLSYLILLTRLLCVQHPKLARAAWLYGFHCSSKHRRKSGKKVYTVFQKTCDQVFDDKLNWNCVRLQTLLAHLLLRL